MYLVKIHDMTSYLKFIVINTLSLLILVACSWKPLYKHGCLGGLQ